MHKKVILKIIAYTVACIFMVIAFATVILIMFLNDDRYNLGLKEKKSFIYGDSMAGYKQYSPESKMFQVIFVSDDDKYNLDSTKKQHICKVHFGILLKEKDEWTFNESTSKGFDVVSNYLYKTRGNEMSEIIQFYDKLYVFDDKTGIGHQLDIKNKKFYARVIMADGNGTSDNAFKPEWATIVDDTLYLGSQGLDSLNIDGVIGRSNKYYVQKVQKNGVYETVDFSFVYKTIDNLLGVSSPGYTSMEAVVFSNINRKWYFAPRKISNIAYNETYDNLYASGKYVIEFDENFQNPRVFTDSQYNKSHGFSSIKLIPYQEDTILYLKTFENEDKFETFIGVMNLEGKMLMQEKSLGANKFEGIEIIPLDI
ncbi:Apyrase precursor, putative [Entamoeba dispar SAW760]|uniref:Apyrase, putative n=1 Tax=Entamoeba dispar (strain ATCC PRA-260 / SAW760) TaxID=370354 RepID=B0EUD8_ENTDS|nr:Apyrase precursor, putative [Entamoeba dispar SAW760]EDR21863.1 Apyrase precursor, putative [Entamoeba dispar SAW760]|eukprot:EDR21863.1 Apyrase precursor, putative [Entamoeba dispar SAW760]